MQWCLSVYAKDGASWLGGCFSRTNSAGDRSQLVFSVMLHIKNDVKLQACQVCNNNNNNNTLRVRLRWLHTKIKSWNQRVNERSAPETVQPVFLSLSVKTEISAFSVIGVFLSLQPLSFSVFSSHPTVFLPLPPYQPSLPHQRQLLSCIRGGNCPGPTVSSLQLPGDVNFFANQLAVPTVEFAFEQTKAEEVRPKKSRTPKHSHRFHFRRSVTLCYLTLPGLWPEEHFYHTEFKGATF